MAKLSSFSPSDYELVQIYLKNAIEAMQIHLAELPEYDITGWKVDERAINRNVIIGITKRGLAVKLLIRPANGNFIKFHQQFEIESL